MTIKQMLFAEIGCSEAMIDIAIERLLAQIWMNK